MGNAYTTKTDYRRNQAIYPVISKANHSCVPNGYVSTHDDNKGEILCIRPITPGEEICVSYITDWQLALPITRRQELTFGNWEFKCQCFRCTSISDDARGFACPTIGCSGRCSIVRGGDTILAIDNGSTIGPRVTHCDLCAMIPS